MFAFAFEFQRIAVEMSSQHLTTVTLWEIFCRYFMSLGGSFLRTGESTPLHKYKRREDEIQDFQKLYEVI